MEKTTVIGMSLPCLGTPTSSSRNIISGSRSWISAFKSAAAAVAGVTLAVNPLSAATKTWEGNASALWNVPANWSGGVPTNGDSIVFGVPSLAGLGSTGTTLIDDIASLTIGSANADGITFGLSASSYIINRQSNQTFTAGTSGTGILIKDLSLFAQTLSVPIALTSDQTIQVGGTSGASISGLTVSGAITGAGRLTKTGTGLLTINGSSNAYAGLTINSGIVSIGSDGQLGAASGSLIINGGALRTNIGSLTLTASRNIELGGATAGSGGTIQVTQTGAGTVFNGVISNGGTANSLTKTGAGTLVLGGANTYTGETKINQGQLSLAFETGGAPVTNIINSASTLVLGGVPNLLNNTGSGNPILFVQGGNSVANSQTFNGLSLAGGGVSNIVVRAGTGTADTTLALGEITHVPGGTVGFSTLTNGSTGTGVITTTTGNTNGILGGWATTAATGTGTAPLTQTDWAMNDGTGKIVAYTGYTSVTGATPAIANNSAANLRIEGTTAVNATLAAAGTTDINTIQSTNTAAHSIALGGKTLRLGTYGGIWKTSTLNNLGLTISGGTLTAGGPNDNTAGEIVFNANGQASFNAAISVGAVIANNGTGAVSVVKQGNATLVLTGANTYSGGTFINQGNIAANNALALGTGSVTVASGATLTLSSARNLTYSNDLYLSGYAVNLYGNTITGKVTLLGDTVIQSNSTDGGTTAGKITGDYNVGFTNGMHTLSNTGNDNSGNTGINALTTGALNTLGNANTGIKLGADEVIANGVGKGNFLIATNSGSTTGTLDMNGKNETINGLVSVGVISNAANAIITNTNAAASTLTLGDNDQTATFGGLIVDGVGTVAITKIGAGTQTFTGASTYTGKTTVAAGTLLLASGTVDSTISGSTVIEVQSGATLNVSGITTLNGFVVGIGQQLVGNGTVVGNTTVQGGLAPGASPGLLTFANNLTLTGTAETTMEIIGTGRGVAGGYDAINLGSTSILTYDGNLVLTMSGIIAGGTYDLFNFTVAALGAFDAVSFGGGFYTGAWTSAGSGIWTASSNGQDFSFNELTGDLNVSAIPEPTTWALLGLGMVAVVLMRRRRVAVL